MENETDLAREGQAGSAFLDGTTGERDGVNKQSHLPNTFADIAASTPLANLITHSFREATKADIGFSVNGLMRAGLTRGKSGVQTVCDVFAVAPLRAGVVDPTAGSALVTGYFTGLELKNLLEFLLVDNPTHPGEYFPRSSGMRFRYDPSRPKFDVVTAIELGDLDRGYRAIDICNEQQGFKATVPGYGGCDGHGCRHGRRPGTLSRPPRRDACRARGHKLRNVLLALRCPGERHRQKAVWADQNRD